MLAVDNGFRHLIYVTVMGANFHNPNYDKTRNLDVNFVDKRENGTLLDFVYKRRAFYAELQPPIESKAHEMDTLIVKLRSIGAKTKAELIADGSLKVGKDGRVEE